MHTEDSADSAKGVEPPPHTAPENISVSLRGFDTEEHANAFGNLVANYVRAISRYIDLTMLDGITIAYDYAQALRELDRGYPASFELMPSNGAAVGIAMTPSVLREGKVKSHMLFHAGVMLPLEDEEHEFYERALHTVAHECAHVEVTATFNEAFPGVLLQSRMPSLHAHCRWEIINACWDEYAVTQICAPFGELPTQGYETTFLAVLKEARGRANEYIKAYRLHGDLERVTVEVYGAYGDLMKFACYHLGNMVGLGLTFEDLPETRSALVGHWFEPYFERLRDVCAHIFSEYGKWQDRSAFEALGDLADEVVADGGLIVCGDLGDGRFQVRIPFTPATMPDAGT
jgi:hypothetical protein